MIENGLVMLRNYGGNSPFERLFAISIDSIYTQIVNRIDYSVTC